MNEHNEKREPISSQRRRWAFGIGRRQAEIQMHKTIREKKGNQQTKQFNELLNGCVNMLIKWNLIIENKMTSWIAMNNNEVNHSL